MDKVTPARTHLESLDAVRTADDVQDQAEVLTGPVGEVAGAAAVGPDRVVPGVKNAHEGGVHGAEELGRRRPTRMGAAGPVAGKVSFSSAWCRWFSSVFQLCREV